MSCSMSLQAAKIVVLQKQQLPLLACVVGMGAGVGSRQTPSAQTREKYDNKNTCHSRTLLHSALGMFWGLGISVLQ